MRRSEIIRNAIALMLALVIMAVPFIYLSANAEAGGVDLSGATVISFAESGIEIEYGSSTGCAVEGNEVKIDSAGTYVLRGESSDASVKVKKETKGVVLVLNGLELASSATAPIVCAKSTEVTIIAAAGTVNTLSDTEMNNDETHADNLDAENAVIKCKDGSSVVIAGEGTLNIIANGKNGIKGGASTETEGESSLTVRELTLNIKANVNDALKADALLNIESGNITIEAADDAIKSDYVLNIGTEGGAGPNINITSSYEGIEAAALSVYSGNIAVNSTDDGINAANSDLGSYSFECNFYGGRVTVNTTAGDGIDSNGNINFAGGEVEMYSSTRSDNSPFDADGSIILTGGTVFGIGMPGMGSLPTSVEQAYVAFGSGGMGGFFGGGMGGGRGGFFGNGSTDNSGSTMQPPTGMNGEMPQPPTDANGSTMQPPTGMNGELPQPPTDANGSTMQPPTGMNGEMPQPPTDANGSQGGFPGGMGGQQGGAAVSISEGDSVSIVDSSGHAVCSVTAKRSAGFVFFSSDSLTEGETYTLVVNGVEAATAQAGRTAAAMGGAGRGRGGRNNEGSAANPGASAANPGASAMNPGEAANGTQSGTEQSGSQSGADEGSANAVNLLHNSRSEGGTGGFARIIAIVLAAAALVAAGCIGAVLVINAKNRKKLSANESGGNDA